MHGKRIGVAARAESDAAEGASTEVETEKRNPRPNLAPLIFGIPVVAGLYFAKTGTGAACQAENIFQSLKGTAAVTALSSVVMFWASIRVGMARMKFKVMPPETTGPPVFTQTFRAQQNMMESLVQFLPALWTFSLYVSAPVATALGLVYLIGRVWYTIGYSNENPSKRFPGFAMAALSTLTLAFGSAIALLPSLF